MKVVSFVGDVDCVLQMSTLLARSACSRGLVRTACSLLDLCKVFYDGISIEN